MCEDACPKCISAHVTCKSTYHASPCWETGGSGLSAVLEKRKKIWKSIRCWSQTSGNCTSWMSWISLLLKQKVLGLAPSWHWKNGFLDPSDPGLVISNLSILFGFWGSLRSSGHTAKLYANFHSRILGKKNTSYNIRSQHCWWFRNPKKPPGMKRSL